MVKVRITKEEARLLKAKGFLVVDEDYAGPELTQKPLKRRSEDFDY